MIRTLLLDRGIYTPWSCRLAVLVALAFHVPRSSNRLPFTCVLGLLISHHISSSTHARVSLLLSLCFYHYCRRTYHIILLNSLDNAITNKSTFICVVSNYQYFNILNEILFSNIINFSLNIKVTTTEPQFADHNYVFNSNAYLNKTRKYLLDKPLQTT